MPTSPHKRNVSLSLHLARSSHSNINLTTSGYSLSTDSTYTHTHTGIYIYISILTYPTHCLAHEPPPPSLLTDSQHAAGKRVSLPEGCPFSPPTPPGTGAKRAPPRPMSSSVWLRCQLRPMTLLFARCYPITSSCTPSLCPGLP